MKLKKNKGFTLIELLVVATIIIILVAVAAVSYEKSRAQARDTRRTSDLANVVSSLRMYFARYGNYPASSSVNGAVCYFYNNSGTNSTCLGALSPEYFEKLPNDPSFSFKASPASTDYIYSYIAYAKADAKPMDYVIVRAKMENVSSATTGYQGGTTSDVSCTASSTDYCLKLKY